MTSNFRADRLEDAFHTYGIVFDENIKWDNEKMIKRLGDRFMELEPEKYSWGAKYVQSLSTPMLCRHLKDDLKGMKFNPVESDDYIAEVKENGFRTLLVYSPESGFEFFSRRESVSNYLNSSFTDKFLFINNGLITEPKDYIGKFPLRFVLDGELLIESSDKDLDLSGLSIEDYIQGVLGSSPERARNFQKDGHLLKMVVFDVLYFEKNPSKETDWEPKYCYEERELNEDSIEWVEEHFSDYLRSAGFSNGSGRAKKLYQYLLSLKDSNKFDLRRFPFIKRRELRTKLVFFLKKKNLPFTEVKWEDTYKVAFTETILSEGGEGAIIKNLYAPYISGMRSSRSHRAAMKVKQNIESMLSSSDEIKDFDVFITGANPPKSDRITDMIGSLSCSVYIKDENGNIKEHEIANVSGISHEWKRKLAFINPETNTIELNPEYRDKVISINGLALTSSNLKFQHATLQHKGELEFKAKNPSECTYDETFLKEMVLVRGK